MVPVHFPQFQGGSFNCHWYRHRNKFHVAESKKIKEMTKQNNIERQKLKCLSDEHKKSPHHKTKEQSFPIFLLLLLCYTRKNRRYFVNGQQMFVKKSFGKRETKTDCFGYVRSISLSFAFFIVSCLLFFICYTASRISRRFVFFSFVGVAVIGVKSRRHGNNMIYLFRSTLIKKLKARKRNKWHSYKSLVIVSFFIETFSKFW